MAHDHDRLRTRDQLRSADDDAFTSAPGRGTASSRMTSPDAPIVSGLVMRKQRDTNGVAAGAETAISAASSSSGEALPTHVRDKFESSLGTDLSSVRVHNGSSSQDAASAVGAKAYTLGNDIHFGAGYYDPASASGQHLLAHEVAHTVQQRGGSPMRQNKLEVSSPSDGFEVEADRAADAMVSGVATSVGHTSELDRTVLRNKDHDPNTSVDPSSPALEGERKDALAPIGAAEAAVVEAMLRMQEWVIGDVNAFITKTAVAPGERFNPGFVKGLVGYGAGKGVKAGGSVISGVVSKLGLRGKLAGMALKLIADSLGSAMEDKIAGGHDPTPDEASDARSAEISKRQAAALRACFAAAKGKFTAMQEDAEKARQKLLSKDTTDGEVDGIRDWANSELQSANAESFQTGALTTDMLSRWVGDHTQDVDTAKGGPDAKRWKKVCVELFGTPNVPPTQVWRYKLRSEWSAAGLDGDQAFQIADVGSTDANGQWMFTSAQDPTKIAKRWGGDASSPRYKYLNEGGSFKLMCSFATRFATSVHLNMVDNISYTELAGTQYTLDLQGKVDGDAGDNDGQLPPSDGHEKSYAPNFKPDDAMSGG